MMKTVHDKLLEVLNARPYLCASVFAVVASIPYFSSFTFLLLPAVYGYYISKMMKQGENLLPVLLFLFLFNVISAGWVGLYSFQGGLYTVLYGAFIQYVPFYLTQKLTVHLKAFFKYLFFISAYLSIEYSLLHTSFRWPWLLLGNSLAGDPWFVQWFEYTGVLGGTLLILIISILFSVFKQRRLISVSIIAFLVMIATFFSFFLKHQLGSTQKVDVMIVQPNLNFKDADFRSKTELHQQELRDLSVLPNGSTVEYVVWPETALLGFFDEDSLHGFLSEEFADILAEATLITGTETKKIHTDTTFQYNSVVLCTADTMQLYHKTVLVPGTETMPFLDELRPVYSLFIDLPSFFDHTQDTSIPWSGTNVGVKPVICFESAFGEYIAKQTPYKGYVIILTNDSWWDGSIGNYQHLRLASLRAIENRMPIARCANSGYSAFINANGHIISQSEIGRKQKLLCSLSVEAEQSQTFYSQYGDYLGSYFVIVFLLIFLLLSLRKVLIIIKM